MCCSGVVFSAFFETSVTFQPKWVSVSYLYSRKKQRLLVPSSPFVTILTQPSSFFNSKNQVFAAVILFFIDYRGMLSGQNCQADNPFWDKVDDGDAPFLSGDQPKTTRRQTRFRAKSYPAHRGVNSRAFRLLFPTPPIPTDARKGKVCSERPSYSRYAVAYW